MAKRKNPYKSKPHNFFLLVFLLGVILMLFAGIIKLNQLRSLSYAGNLPQSSSQNKDFTPDRIVIAKAKIDLPIGNTYIAHDSWQIFNGGASHLVTSANPGENGNIIIYGHNTLNRFGRLTELKKGDIINVHTVDGKEHKYIVSIIKTVNSSDTSPLQLTNKEVLTLYTCTGFADLKRLVIQAKPQV